MQFEDMLKQYKGIIDKELNSLLNNYIEKSDGKFLKKTYETVQKYISCGKRLRPIAIITAYESIKGKNSKIIMPASSVELLHNSTLCHDDIMDEDMKRRNNPSCHKSYQEFFQQNFNDVNYKGDIFSKESMRFGVSTALSIGNILTFMGNLQILKSTFSDEVKKEAIERVTQVLLEVNEGQMFDIYFENMKNASETDYLNVIRKKTAVLLGCAFEMGAIFAEAPEKIKKAFFEYGLNLGLAFQIADDLMDINKNAKKGNSFGSDIKKGKKTIILIKALELGNKSKIESILKGKITDIQVEEVVQIFEECGATRYAKNLAKEKIMLAKEKINSISKHLDEEYVDFFINIADYMISRKI